MQVNLFENTSGLKSLLEKIDRLKSELDALRPLNAEQEARVMQKFRLDWNYHSNSIEGNSLTYGETIAFLMEGLTAKGKPFKDHLDIKGHNEAINYLMDMVANRHELTENAIRELHTIILVEPYKTPAQTSHGQQVEKQVTLGAYKKMPNHVQTPTGEIHYYATPEETPAKMADLMDWLRAEQEKAELHPLILAAVFHYRFVEIHPFDDGNGRMSRLLMNLLLMQYGYPPVVIKQEERNLYYNALRQADGGELAVFVEFIGENLVRALEIFLRGAKGESIEESDDLDKEIALLKALLSTQEEVIPKSRDVILQLLSETLIPLYQEIEKYCHKLDDLFFKSESSITWGENFAKADQSLPRSMYDWNIIIDQWLKGNFIQTTAERISQFNYEYHWINFKKTNDPFSIFYFVKVQFKDFRYEIEFKGFQENIHILKQYSEKLSKEEKYQISTIFTKEALLQIKARTQK